MIQPGRTYVAALTLGSKSPVVQATLAAAAAKKVTAMAAELRGEVAKGPAKVSLAKGAALDSEDAVTVSDADGDEVEVDVDATLNELVASMVEAFPIAGESVQQRIERAKQLLGALRDWVGRGQPDAPTPNRLPMVASAYGTGSMTMRALRMVQASKAWRGRHYDEQFREAVRLVRAGAVI